MNEHVQNLMTLERVMLLKGNTEASIEVVVRARQELQRLLVEVEWLKSELGMPVPSPGAVQTFEGR